MGSFTVFADEAQKLDRAHVGCAEPVRRTGVELGDLAGFEREVVFAEDESQHAVEDIHPVIAVVGAKIGFSPVRAEHELVGLDTAGVAGQRNDRRPVTTLNRAQVDAWVSPIAG